MNNNQEVPYTNPETVGLSEERREELLRIEERGQKITEELKKIGLLCAEKFGFNKIDPGSWLDGSKTKTRKYLWLQLKKNDYESDPISISVFVEKNGDTTGYRTSLEIKNDGIDKSKMATYHKHLELNQAEGLVYVTGSNEWGRPAIIQEPLEKIREKYQAGDYRKVQPSIYIEYSDNKTNDQYEEEVLSAVKKIVPYYNHVLGIDDKLNQSLEKMDLSEIMKEDRTVNTTEFDKNIILYGPPGTGKTYSSAKYAVAICDGLSLEEVTTWDYDKVLKRYDELKKENRIVFTTFHQSYGYEEFIEGIKPVMSSDDDNKSDIGYKVEDGIFKDFCNKASKVTIDRKVTQVGDSAKVWMVILGGSETPELAEQCFQEKTIRIGWREAAEHVEEDDDNLNDKERRILLNFQDEMEIGDIVVSRASATEINGIGIITGEYEFDESNPRYPRKRKIDWLYTGEKINIFNLNGKTRLDRKSVYPLGRIKSDDILKLIPSENIIQNETRPYVFIIDEINRGNISKIFGELITLIESTKRKGAEEAMEVVLPYSGEPFSVPNNVYILGTMNTADRSIALMDTALRRRFGFAEMMPDASLLDDVNIEDNGVSVNIGQMLRVINDRITFLYDREHTIGHAFFMKLVNGGTVSDLAAIFEKSVVPLLQEYFYEDYEKIRLVLGDSAKKEKETHFIQVEDIPDDLFDIDVSETIDISEEKNYTIAYGNFKNIMTYKGISKKL